jgi:hypothetical protein
MHSAVNHGCDAAQAWLCKQATGQGETRDQPPTSLHCQSHLVAEGVAALLCIDIEGTTPGGNANLGVGAVWFVGGCVDFTAIIIVVTVQLLEEGGLPLTASHLVLVEVGADPVCVVVVVGVLVTFVLGPGVTTADSESSAAHSSGSALGIVCQAMAALLHTFQHQNSCCDAVAAIRETYHHMVCFFGRRSACSSAAAVCNWTCWLGCQGGWLVFRAGIS